MQFRAQNNRIQVLAYRGYDKEKQRSVVKLVGSFDMYSFALSEELLENLSGEEVVELQREIKYRRLTLDSQHRQSIAKRLATDIKSASDSMSLGECDSIFTEEYAQGIYDAIDVLTKALRRRGFSRSQLQKTVNSNSNAAVALLDSTTINPEG